MLEKNISGGQASIFPQLKNLDQIMRDFSVTDKRYREVFGQKSNEMEKK